MATVVKSFAIQGVDGYTVDIESKVLDGQPMISIIGMGDGMTEIITTYKPDEMGIEKLFFNTNEKTAIDVAQARGVTLLPAIIRNIPIYEYTPLQVKCSIVGYGRAEKKQVQEMTKTMLHLKAIPKPDDTADAVAIAITHGLSVNTRRVMKNFEEK